MLNNLTISGRLTADPEVRRTPNGVSVTNFSIAVDRDYDKEKADFFRCVSWRSTADFIGKYFKKGNRIEIAGHLENSEWTDKEGNKRVTTEIVADRAYFCESRKSEAAPDGAFYDFNGPVEQMETDADENDLPF